MVSQKIIDRRKQGKLQRTELKMEKMLIITVENFKKWIIIQTITLKKQQELPPKIYVFTNNNPNINKILNIITLFRI